MKTFNKMFQGDRVIWVIVMLLSISSLLAVYSATGTYANARYGGNNTYVLMRHAGTLAIGLVCMYFAHLMKYSYYSRIFQLAFFASIPLLIYTLFFGADLNDAQRVVHIFGVSFQSSDFAKVALIGYIARELTLRKNNIKDFKNAFIPLMIPVLIIVGLIFPENFSTAAILFACCMIILFVGRINMKHILIFIGIGIVAIIIYMSIMLSRPEEERGRTNTWVNRVENFAESFKKVEDGTTINYDEEDYQLVHSKIAIAGGGFLGKTPGKSTQRNILPHPYSDFIYAIILEEYGLAGGIFVMLLYLILLYRVIAILVKMPQSFGGYLAFGLGLLIVMQAMTNMGVAVGVLPVTGQPLPMISMGGTSLMFTGFALGVILSVSKEVNKTDIKTDEIELSQSDN